MLLLLLLLLLLLSRYSYSDYPHSVPNMLSK
jgi:hypothetical protein